MGTAITFDFHNTLVRCDEWFDLEVRYLPVRVGEVLGLSASVDVTEIYRSLRKNVIAHGVELDATAGVVESWQRAGITLDPAAVTPVIDEVMRELVPRSALLPGVDAALSAALDTNARIGIVSSAVHHDFLEWALVYHDVRDAFDAVFTSASVGYYKSRPEIYELALAQLGALPAGSVHIGDSFRFDHGMGASLGMQTIWLNESGHNPMPEGPAPSAVIESMSDLPGVLTTLMGARSLSDAS